MKNATRYMLIVALAAFPFAADAGDIEESLGDDFSQDFASAFQMGGWTADVEGSPDKVAEYQPADGSPTLNILMDSHSDWGSLLLGFDYNASKDNQGKLDFDFSRMVRSHNTYNKFIHRDPHDRMLNLEATSTNGKVVQHTDFSPNAEYGVTYQDFKSRNEFQFEGLSAITIGFEYRDQRRDGHQQAYTTSHCDTCHIKSQDHPMNERTRDAKADLTFGFKGGSIKGSWNHRTLSYRQNSVGIEFDNALHPELQVPVFNNRLQYDDEVGTVQADLWPEQEKSTGRLDFNLTNVGGFAFNVAGIYQDSKNDYTGYRSTYKGGLLKATRALGKKARFRWGLKGYSLDNDSVWIDVNDRESIAGPHAGQTYEESFGVNFDHWRNSALNRDVLESNLEFSYRVSKALGTFRLRWDYKSTDREYYQVTPDSGETTRNLLGIYWRARPAKSFKLLAHYKHAEINNPFMLVDGACSTLVSPGASNPWGPDTAQYYEFHDARIAETTSSPSSFDEAKLGFTWMLGTATTLSANYKWWDGSNTDGDLTQWDRSNQVATVTLWSAPSSGWNWHLGYAYQDSELKAPLCIPVFDG